MFLHCHLNLPKLYFYKHTQLLQHEVFLRKNINESITPIFYGLQVYSSWRRRLVRIHGWLLGPLQHCLELSPMLGMIDIWQLSLGKKVATTKLYSKGKLCLWSLVIGPAIYLKIWNYMKIDCNHVHPTFVVHAFFVSRLTAKALGSSSSYPEKIKLYGWKLTVKEG